MFFWVVWGFVQAVQNPAQLLVAQVGHGAGQAAHIELLFGGAVWLAPLPGCSGRFLLNPLPQPAAQLLKTQQVAIDDLSRNGICRGAVVGVAGEITRANKCSQRP